MDSVIAAFLMIFLNLFAVLTLASSFISSQDAYQVGLRDMQARLNEQVHTSLQQINGKTINNGTVIQMVYKNNGSEKISDYKNWDVIVQYYDTSSPTSKYYTTWVPYTDSIPSNNEWAIKGIYADFKRNIAEAYDPKILNPGEEIVIEIHLPRTVALSSQVQVTLAVKNGANVSTVFVRNIPPVLFNNFGVKMPSATSKTIDETALKSTDADNDVTELVYTVTTPPAQGTLNLGNNFTEFDLMKEHLRYTHTGTGSDSFQFTVSDGEDEIGAYTFNITVSVPPVLQTNAGLTMASNTTAPIIGSNLTTTDVDNTSDQLTYTITTLPQQGSLSKTTFTQQDIDNGNFQYTHVGAGPDSFQFKVSDGISEIGPFTFNISVS
ncbi:MAG: hypothetical protein GC179_16840 [Anaerolineaceae bacterium]|nr:hypothetical protein [Anaerolineaceae bacterium]